MNIKRLMAYSLLGGLLVFSVGCGTDAASAQSKGQVKEQVTKPVFDATPIADEYATIKTNRGDIKLHLYGSKAPITVKNFNSLVKKGYYDGLVFHRVIEGFMIQGGDDGKGGPGYEIPDEFVKDLHFNKMGMLAMANRGPNTGGAQFFITVAPTPWLDNKHTIFGTVIQGMEIVEAISKVETDKNDRPKSPIVIESISIEPIPTGMK